MKQFHALNILKAGRNVYLTGAAGSGKTHVLNEYISYLKHRGVNIGITASTGIAATHIGGVTIHSWSGIGIRDTLSEYEIEALEQKEYLWKRFSKTKVLIIDEVSMLSPRAFDTIEKVCRTMKRNDEPFGGMQVILAGDFFQLPPISRGSSEVEFINKSRAWRAMNIRACYLDEQFRQTDNVLEKMLNEMRKGNASPLTRSKLNTLRDKKFNNNITPTRLYTHNADVDALNDKELEKLPGKEMKFEMTTTGRATLINTLKKGLLTPETLRLKKGASVMFIKNNLEEGYVNGTLGIVEDFDEGLPSVRTFSGKKITVYSAKWEIMENGKTLAAAEQLPLRLAWAITIHKSQGMSIDAAEIDLSKSFMPGQGYVALSRLRSLEGLSLLGLNEMAFAAHPDVAKLDERLLIDSRKWEKAVDGLSGEKLDKLHNKFIIQCGGTLDKKEIEKNKTKAKKGLNKKVPTHEQTKALIDKGLSLKEIAKERGMTTGTIIAHFEKLKQLDDKIDLNRFKPNSADFKKIRDAFKTLKDMSLTPARKKLRNMYSYEELRLARLFL